MIAVVRTRKCNALINARPQCDRSFFQQKCEKHSSQQLLVVRPIQRQHSNHFSLADCVMPISGAVFDVAYERNIFKPGPCGTPEKPGGTTLVTAVFIVIEDASKHRCVKGATMYSI